MSKIFIIDDSNLTRTRITDVLQKNGYTNVLTFDSADIIGKSPQLYFNDVSLIITDVMLPGTSGIELKRILNNYPKYKNIPTIFISVSSEKKLINEAIEVGAADYIVKPFDDQTLLERVNKILKDSANNNANNQIVNNKEEIERVISIEHERAVRGHQPLSFIKLNIETEDLKICTVHIRNIIRKIDMVYIVNQTILIILPLTDEKGAELVYEKISERAKECSVSILEKELQTFNSDTQKSSNELIELLM